MIDYKELKLDNGLTILAHRDTASKMAAFNILYKVGARNENPSRTGFAHLFEHLMFRGTKNIPDFDMPVQQACGENNAFTNNDYTDYYITLPKDNIETAFWLESDRMTGLDITPEALETEKRVVIEEFNQRYINQPYGDQWMLLRGMAYKSHPYRWATIGITPDHVAAATLEDVTDFYHRYYNPSNAVIGIAADIEQEKVLDMARKWFGPLNGPESPKLDLPVEPEQLEARRQQVERNVPASAITIAFKMGARLSREFYVCDIISDILSGGTSSRLYQSLVKTKKLFSGINAYITGDIDPGLFVVTGQLNPGTGIDEAEKQLLEELDKLKNIPVSEYEMDKVKNKFEAGVIFGELNVMNKALNLCFYNMLDKMELLNSEVDIFRSVTSAEIMSTATEVFAPQRSSTLIYLKKDDSK